MVDMPCNVNVSNQPKNLSDLIDVSLLGTKTPVQSGPRSNGCEEVIFTLQVFKVIFKTWLIGGSISPHQEIQLACFKTHRYLFQLINSWSRKHSSDIIFHSTSKFDKYLLVTSC